MGVPCDLSPMSERLSHCLNEDLHSAPSPRGHLPAPVDHEALRRKGPAKRGGRMERGRKGQVIGDKRG